MKFINLAALLMGAYSIVSVATYMVAQILSGHGLWADEHDWHHVPDGLRQMLRVKETGNQQAINAGKEETERITRSNIPGRFPAYGTREFRERCNWTETTAQHGPDCTFLVRPKQGENEGIALWVSQVVEGYILARQAGCRLLVDYGTDINIHQVVTTAPDLGTGRDDDLRNWTVPDGFSCTKNSRCFTLPDSSRSKANVSFTEVIPGRRPLATVPFYRFALWGVAGDKAFFKNMFRDLEQTLPGFQIESGMACSLGQVFHLAASASQFEPRLFTDLLPKLRDANTLVMTLYIRTSQTEKEANATEDEKYHRGLAKGYIKSVFAIEEKYLTGAIEHKRDIRRIVWMVVSDSQYLKQWAADTYGGEDVNARVSANKQKWKSREIRREVLFTVSRGAHTRAKQNPSTVDFAEAFIDWYLIGESDIVLVGAFTFGLTGSLRTARPVYNKIGKLLELVRPGEGPSPGRSIQVKTTLGAGPVKFKGGL